MTTTYTFTPINISQPIGSDVYVAADGIDTAGEVVGSYGYTDGDDDSYFHGFTATGSVGTTFDPPGSSNTNGIGITASGEIFGSYVDWENRQHGFVYSNGAFQQIDVLLASSTIVDGVTNAGTIFGTYVDEFGFGINGFIDNNGSFTILDVPGASTTSVSGLNAGGEIVGTYTDGSGQAHGFADINGTFATIDPAGSISTSVAGVSATGEVAGNYENSSSVNNGFIDNNGVITTIVIPGATETGVSAINDAGEVVGYYADSLGNVHGFIEQNGVTTTIDVPGATETDINGVSDSGIITGFYNDSSYTQHGFVGVPEGLIVDGTLSDAPQGGSPVALLTGATISDPGKANLASASIRVANGGGSAVAGDQLLVNSQQSGTIDGGAIAVSWNASTATLTLTGTASPATYQTLLSEVTYQDTGTDPLSGSHPHRTVTWAVNDGTQNLITTSQVAIDRAPVANNDTATDVVGTILSVSAAGGVLANDTDPDADALSVASVSDTASGTVVVGQRIAGRYGHLWLSANGSYTYTADIGSAINSAATGSHLQDVFSYTTGDGNGGSSNTATLDITLDRPPAVTVSNVTLPASNIVAASSLFSVGNPDPDGDPITQYSFYDSSSTPSSGQFLFNGAAQPKGTNQPLVVSAAQLSQVTFQSGTNAGDDLYITAYAGSATSNVGQVVASVTPPPPPPSSAPAITFNDQTVAPSQSVPLTSIFSVSGSGITEYQVWFSHPEGGNPALGTVTNNGIPIALDQPVTVASLNGLSYIGSSTPGTDILFLRAYDGVWSDWNWAGLTDQGLTAPVITPNNQPVANSQSVALSNIFSLSSSSPVTQYQVWFSHPAGGNPALGTVTDNGNPIAINQPVPVTSLSGLTYTGSATAGTDVLFLQAFDGAWSGWMPALLTDPGITPAVITPNNQTVANNQSIALSNIFSLSSSGPITQYRVWFSHPAGGNPALGTVTDNGNPIAINQPVPVTSLSGLTYTGSATAGTDVLFLQAFDGAWSGWMPALLTDPGITPAVITPNNQTVADNQSVALTNIFSLSSSSPITQYQVWFSHPAGGNPALGTVTDNGNPIAVNQPVPVTSLSGLNYTGSATAGTDVLFLRAFDGAWSGWMPALLTDPGITPAVITPNNQTVVDNQSVALTNIFSLSSSSPITQYQVWFSHPAGGNPALGTVADNGNPIAINQPVPVTNLNGLNYTGSATPGTDVLFLQAFDGVWSGWMPALLTDPGNSSSQPGSSADGASGSLNHTVSLLSQYMAAGFGSSDFGPTNQLADPKMAQDQSNFLAPAPLSQSHPT